MTEVWVLTDSGGDIHGVFTTKAKAEEAQDVLTPTVYLTWVTQFPLDELVEL